MKKLLLLLLVIPNLVMAETWVCSYLHQGEIKRATFFKAKDNLGNEFYRFVGLFKFIGKRGGFNVFERTSDSIEVLPVQDN